MKDMTRPDAKTRELLRQWGPREVPSVQVTGGTIPRPGIYRAMATLGWIEKRGHFSIVGVHLIVLRRQDTTPIAAVTIGLPVTPRSETFVNGFLVRLGWDGRVWPYDNDKGWPENTDDAQQLTMLMQKGQKLSSTFCFRPHPEKGVPIIDIPILKRSVSFSWAPFEETALDTPPASTIERFRQLCADPSPFFPSN